jgi:hypothetical protein
MLKDRKNPRYNSMAKVQIPGKIKNDGLLKNISVTGCCFIFFESIEIETGDSNDVLVLPEKTSGKKKFELQAECKWIRKLKNSSEFGFSITASPTGKHFQNYVDYLAFHSTQR